MQKPKPHKETHSRNDTIQLSHGSVDQWKAPPFQRPLKVNAKVAALAVELKANGGVIPGTITLGILDKQTFLLDGQHRIHAWKMSELETGYADVKYLYCETVGEMAEEFYKSNSRLVNMRPDDYLKAMEESNDHMKYIRRRCPYVGYDFLRRGSASPILSMSSVLRCWAISAPETPGGGGTAAVALADGLTQNDAEHIVTILNLCHGAWGRDSEYSKLWGALNLTLVMWMYRRMVVVRYSPNTVQVSKDQFGKCLMSLSASTDYLDWLVGRNLGERDRSPAFRRIKEAFAKRLEVDMEYKQRLPAPEWAHGK